MGEAVFELLDAEPFEGAAYEGEDVGEAIGEPVGVVGDETERGESPTVADDEDDADALPEDQGDPGAEEDGEAG